ncbi:DUF3592 domain-containing protein [Pseudonocardiaceae bacterium YIM PH 21723]|nr:DUF3592 domain-containing protein [Pseudonocardiaceae bacterium YIM PH 21723]
MRRRLIIAALLGFLLLVATAVIGFRLSEQRAEGLLATGVPGKATVLDKRVTKQRITYRVHYQLRVQDGAGRTHEAKLFAVEKTEGYGIGERIPVFYDADDPTDLRTREQRNDPVWADLVPVLAASIAGLMVAFVVTGVVTEWWWPRFRDWLQR